MGRPDDTSDLNTYSSMGRPMSSGEQRQVNRKIDENKDLIYQHKVDLVSLSKDVEGLKREVKHGNDKQDTAFGVLKAAQEVNTKAIEGIQKEAALEHNRSTARHSEILKAIGSLNEKADELDKRITPPPRDSVSSLVAVAVPSRVVTAAAPLPPLAPQPSLYQQLTPSQKGYTAGAAVGIPALIIAIWEALAPYLAG